MSWYLLITFLVILCCSWCAHFRGLINLTIRCCQCAFVSSKNYIIGLAIQTWQYLSVDNCIRDLGTATPYGCNDKIDGIVILSSLICRSVNVMDVFNSADRRKRSHDHPRYTFPTFHDVFSTIYAEIVGYASHSLETIFTTTFKTTCIVQLIFGKRMNTNLQQSSWILPVTDFSNLLVLRKIK